MDAIQPEKQNERAWAEERFSKPITRRRFVVGDIHGCIKTFQRMVEVILQLKQDDTLFLLGDYIDRGPDSKGVLDYLLQLLESNYDIRPLLGNHEAMLLNAIDDESKRPVWYGNGGWATMHQFNVDSPETIPQRYQVFLRQLPYVLTTNDYVFVHAGLDFRSKDPIKDSSSYYMLWSRDFFMDASKIEGRVLVAGHTMTPLFSIKESLATKRISLDNGCFSKGEISYGSLVALDLDKRELLIQENIE
ncbi:metallophosphoesterase family protein [Pelotalea chapellei]|uniref:Serine/threonine protein phosphatase n=1 Tax=Pelotalea chapellei TaxID=44671 RepID=A0ABS5U4V6_9BACT|nr:metallophosphoesterase family protein [Pelotalea chapellei]MBT1070687.1 serine/threonine protein phosphatase [Pelotalea chapellei]